MISDIRIIKAVRVRVRATGACVNREKVRVRAPGACVLWSKMSEARGEDFLSARFRAGLVSRKTTKIQRVYRRMPSTCSTGRALRSK